MLRELWEHTKEPAPIIAGKISTHFGFFVSRNAVIGKAHRLRMKPRADPRPAETVPAIKQRHYRERLAEKRRTRRQVVRQEVAKMIKEGPPIVYVVPPRREDVWQPLRGGDGIPLTELTEHTCKWPYSSAWNTAATGFCGAAVELGKPYCSRHLQFALSPKPLRDASKSYGGWK